MALGLRFTDGTTTLDVSNLSTGIVTELTPGTPKNLEDETVVDKGKVLFLGGLSTIRTNIQTLNRLFRQALRYDSERQGPRVYVERDLGDGVWWRSLLKDGSPLPEDETLDWMLAAGKMEFGLQYTRANWWEGQEAQVPLTNGNGSNNTSGLTVRNHDDADAGDDNYVQIAGGQVSGDLPGPARLEITNTYAGGALGRLWIGHSFTNATSLTHILEAEDGGANDVNVTGASGGKVKRVTVEAGTTVVFRTWSLSQTILNACAGAWFKALLRWDTWADDVYYRFRIDSGYAYDSGYILPDKSVALAIRDLCAFQLPPNLPDLSGYGSMSLELVVYNAASVSRVVGIDFLQLTPIDGWRYLTFLGDGMAQGRRLIDDAITGVVLTDDGAGAARKALALPYGKPIHLKPAVNQRLYFLQHSVGANSAAIDRTLSVKVYYRPRRMTI